MSKKMKWIPGFDLDFNRPRAETFSQLEHERAVAEFLANGGKVSTSRARPAQLKVPVPQARKPAARFAGPLCQKCGEPIRFKQLDNGKWCPTNPDGSDHWDDCKRESLRRAGKRMLMTEFDSITVPLGTRPTGFDESILPWDDSIESDWSWCRGYRVQKVKPELTFAVP